MADRLFVIERRLIIDAGYDVPVGHSTWHRIRATGAAEALARFTTLYKAEILGDIVRRGDLASAIVEADQRVYRLIAVAGERPFDVPPDLEP